MSQEVNMTLLRRQPAQRRTSPVPYDASVTSICAIPACCHDLVRVKIGTAQAAGCGILVR